MPHSELSSSVALDPSYDSFTLYNHPEEERRRRRMKRVALVGAVMLCITAAAVGGLLSWDNGNQGHASPGYAGGPPPMSLHDYGGEPGEDAGYGPEGVPSFMVVGDWGCSSNCPQFPTADTDQLSVSEQMTKASKRDPNMQFVVSTGDNFYMRGVENDQDDLWETVYTDRFGGIDLPWYAVLGEHDHYGNSEAQLSTCSDDGCPEVPPQWNMPWYNYTIVRPGGGGTRVQLVFIDTFVLGEGYSGQMIMKSVRKGQADEGDMSTFVKYEKERSDAKHGQLQWLEETLRDSIADWLIVVGHYPVYSGGEHGDSLELIRDVKPLLDKYQVDMYMCGHDHGLQHLKEGAVDYVVSGGGSRRGKVGLGAAKQTQYASDANGFAIAKVDSDRASVTLLGAFGQVLYHFQREKRRDPAALKAAAEKRKHGHGEAGTESPRLKTCIDACESVRGTQPEQKNCEGGKCWSTCQRQCIKTWNRLKTDS